MLCIIYIIFVHRFFFIQVFGEKQTNRPSPAYDKNNGNHHQPYMEPLKLKVHNKLTNYHWKKNNETFARKKVRGINPALERR